ncbi:polysaccharide deacetylase [Sphingopyxis sp. BSNA05]|uniref:polysaccharide deacetylase family protein n=1 Tax=Sphingopyxis sp. BSNA05 TaxID=1236614 RepID=UPI0015649CC0|nr:polysaccharide deacetylase family protein [Sphingopyxis sp. BSNA05]NRD90872.1 polysaccharide deacetylase [Sphingopyxis sp. BSNA05]
MLALAPRLFLPSLLLAIALFAFWRPDHGASEVMALPAPVAMYDKRIAFSFDDAPRGKGAFLEPDERPKLLIEALKTAGIDQAAFFINSGRITANDNDAADIEAYAAAGHVLANHTARHSKLSSVSVETFLADIDAAEVWLKGKPNYRPWFRFPFLDEGRKNRAKRDAVRTGLKKRGLMNGYVTVDASDWYLEDMAISAARAGKIMDWNALRDLFVESYTQSANFADDLARRTLGRAPVQMILLHETDLSAMFVDDLAAALKADGWTIVTADEAYRDPIAFMEPDVDFADGTRTQMLAAERNIGNRWYERNDQK